MFKTVAPYSFGQRNRWLAHLVDCTEGRLERFAIGVKPLALNGFPIVVLRSFFGKQHREFRTMGRGLLLWLLGIPIPVLILLYVFHVI
jgi:hypothetical protein